MGQASIFEIQQIVLRAQLATSLQELSKFGAKRSDYEN